MSTQQSSTPVEIAAWLRDLPKVEVHLHLEGTISPETLVVLSKRNDAIPLTLEQAKSLYIYHDFRAFLESFGAVNSRLQTPDDFALITYEMIRSLAEQGCVHAEVYISWGILMRYKPHLPITTIMDVVETARARAETEFGTSVTWIIDVVRQHGLEIAQTVVDLAIRLKERYPTVIGIGIGGDEVLGPAIAFRELYAQARAADLRLVAHAGEASGPESIWAALEIGAERIGHGLTAQQDAELLKVLVEKQTPMEICVTSNLRTGCCVGLDVHPVRGYLEGGLMVTINSDDPTMFGSSLLQEYELVQKQYGLSLEMMRGLAANSVKASFLPSERKQRLLEAVEQYELQGEEI